MKPCSEKTDIESTHSSNGSSSGNFPNGGAVVDAGVSAVIPPDALYATSEKVSNRMMVSPGLPSAGSTSTTASTQHGGGGGLGDATATTPLEGSKVRWSYRESDTLLLLVAAVEEVEEGEPSRTLVRKGNKWQRGGEIKTKSPDGVLLLFSFRWIAW